MLRMDNYPGEELPGSWRKRRTTTSTPGSEPRRRSGTIGAQGEIELPTERTKEYTVVNIAINRWNVDLLTGLKPGESFSAFGHQLQVNIIKPPAVGDATPETIAQVTIPFLSLKIPGSLCQQSEYHNILIPEASESPLLYPTYLPNAIAGNAFSQVPLTGQGMEALRIRTTSRWPPPDDLPVMEVDVGVYPLQLVVDFAAINQLLAFGSECFDPRIATGLWDPDDSLFEMFYVNYRLRVEVRGLSICVPSGSMRLADPAFKLFS